MDSMENSLSLIDPVVLESEFVSTMTSKPLRVCCYGSSSAATPEKYLVEARSLGYILAKRGHTCVNGAGSRGCMAAMNDGADAGNGHIVGVIHEMFVVDGSDWLNRDGGAHGVFHNIQPGSNNSCGSRREILIAGGHDLQERKRLLVDKADGLVVLPGGPGTWDELWEMACARNLGLTDLPIVCVSVDGYYDPFQTMLQRAYEEQLIRLEPEYIVHFEPTAEKAIRWLEQFQQQTPKENPNKVKERGTLLHKSSVLHPPTGSTSGSFNRKLLWKGGKFVFPHESWWNLTKVATIFAAGCGVGVLVSWNSRKR